MSANKHTPGPWHVMADGFTRKGLWSAPTVYATDDELRYIAVCACADHPNFAKPTDNLANARLIAAAPDLLQALTKLRDADDMGKPDGHNFMGPELRAATDAALSRAQGEPS